MNYAPPEPARAEWLDTLRRSRVPLAVAAVCIALSFGGDTLRELARYERVEIASGEIWRIATAHLVHLGLGHTLLNVVALAILVWLFDDVLDDAEWALVTIASALAIDGGLFWLARHVDWYVGLSGVLHGVMIAGSLKLIARRAGVGWLLLAATVGKLLWEEWGGPVPLSELTSGGPVVTEAHLYGAVGGALALIALTLVRRARRPPL